MKLAWFIWLAALPVPFILPQVVDRQKAMHEASAVTYEHLATAIVEIRRTEDALVRGILLHHAAAARMHLEAAAAAGGGDARDRLESAAQEIAAIANEGDKRVQAVRQRLLEAGHHHHTDAETQEDYIFIDGKEKQALLALAERAGKLAADPSPAAIRSLGGELATTLRGALQKD